MPSDTDPEAGGDPIRRLLDSPADAVSRLRARHWVGLGCLTFVVGLTAMVLPPLISPAPAPPVAVSAADSIPAPTLGVPRASDPASGTPASSGSVSATVPSSPRPHATTAGPTGTAARVPVPSGTGAGFTTITVQAEDPANTLSGGAEATNCDTCDGGGRVRYIGAGPGTLVVHLTVAVARERVITVEYECSGSRTLLVAINGGTPVKTTVTGDDWSTPHSYQFTALVPSGAVSLSFYNTTQPAPDVDKVTVG